MSNVEQEKKFCYLLASSTKIHHYRSPVNKFCMSTVQVKGKTVALSRILVDCLKQSSMHVNHMDSKRISTFSSFRQKQKCIYYTTCFMWCKNPARRSLPQPQVLPYIEMINFSFSKATLFPKRKTVFRYIKNISKIKLPVSHASQQKSSRLWVQYNSVPGMDCFDCSQRSAILQLLNRPAEPHGHWITSIDLNPVEPFLSTSSLTIG